MGSHIFGFLGIRQFFLFTVSKSTRIFVTADETVKCCLFNLKLKWVNSEKWKVTKLGSQKLHIRTKVTKMGSIIGHRIDYNGVAKIIQVASPPLPSPGALTASRVYNSFVVNK